MTAFQRCARYSPNQQMFVCENADQVKALEDAGWKALPSELDTPYAPDMAQWVPQFDMLDLQPKAPDDPPVDPPPKSKKK